jgi:hypothetical protein
MYIGSHNTSNLVAPVLLHFILLTSSSCTHVCHSTDITAVSATSGFYLGSFDFEGTNIQSMEWAQGDNSSAVYVLLNDYPVNGNGNGATHGNGRLVKVYLSDDQGVLFDIILDFKSNDYAYGYAASSYDPTSRLFYTMATTGLLDPTNPRVWTFLTITPLSMFMFTTLMIINR